MNNDDETTKADLRKELRQTRSRLRELEAELAETNEGMVALTLELEDAKERYQTIFEESTDAILIIDPKRDTIHEANPQASDLLGYDHDTLLTLSPMEIFPDERDRSRSFVEAVVQGWANGFTCRTNDGRKVDVDILASMVTLDGRSLLLASLRDVTERKRREQRLQVLSRVFRHNLRNDGNVIQGHADLLHDELAGSEFETSTLQIRRMIDGLLELSSKVRRIEKVLDRNRIKQHPLDVVIADIQEWCRETYPSVEMEVQFESVQVSVGQRVSVAIQEAIENAVNHAEREPTIRLSVAVDDDDGGQVSIFIEDDGPGIPGYELDVIQNGGETPLQHSSGVGLWFIYWAVDSLGGDISIREGDSGGTIISLTVPVEEAPDDE